ncbi:MAG TPA: DUF554 domain-containing protein [Rectinemataceae bacterium]|nr:DUF554 domain-containing protein [Rectinemataceae bacterium]
MLATLVNALAIVVGSFLGLLIKKGLSKRYEHAIFAAAGVITLVLGMKMAFAATHILAFALALILGGLAGTLMDIEGAVLRLGEILKNRFAKNDKDGNFAYGFLSASVLFCSGAMAILGSFRAGTEGDYSLLFTKSVLDGFLSLLFASAMGIGVAFAALSVLVYQGSLTLLSVWAKPYVTPVMLNELTGVGGALIIMIGIELLDLRKMKTGDFLPALLATVVFVLAMPYVPFLAK